MFTLRRQGDRQEFVSGPRNLRDIRVKIAVEADEFEQAFKLVTANYRARGYEGPSEKPFRFTPFHTLPGTVTLVALHHGRVLATLTLVPDSDILGLPMESIYGPEVAQLRQAGLRPAEAICLADTGLAVREFIQVFKALIKLAMQYHARHDGDSWVITVNPRHSSFYQKVLGFVPRDQTQLPHRPEPSRRGLSVDRHDDGCKRSSDVPGRLRGRIARFGADGEPMVRAACAATSALPSSQLDPETLEELLDAIDRAELPSC